MGGHNVSRFAGAGQEFLDHRNFHHGDDLRAVNWRAYHAPGEAVPEDVPDGAARARAVAARHQRLHVGGQRGRSSTTRASSPAALGYVGLVRLDTLEIHHFAGAPGPSDLLHAAGGTASARWSDCLTAMQAGGAHGYFAVVREFVSTYSQRGLVIVISDFLDDQGCEKPLQYLADFGHELLLIQVWAEEDRTPPWMGELELADAESGERDQDAVR